MKINKKEILSRDEMKMIMGGDVGPRPCSVCVEDPWYFSVAKPCVPWHCQSQVLDPDPGAPCPTNDPACS